jgi:hypothetical protein
MAMTAVIGPRLRPVHVLVRLAQLELLDLPGRGHRQRRQEDDALRHLEAAQVLAAMRGERGFVEASR